MFRRLHYKYIYKLTIIILVLRIYFLSSSRNGWKVIALFKNMGIYQFGSHVIMHQTLLTITQQLKYASVRPGQWMQMQVHFFSIQIKTHYQPYYIRRIITQIILNTNFIFSEIYWKSVCFACSRFFILAWKRNSKWSSRRREN